MADLDIYYKGNKIFTADDDVRENLNTAGTYCEEDIIVDYKKPTLPPLTNPATDSEVVDGYEYYDDQGVAQTGSFAPPVDTGENGLYKAVMSNEATEFISDEITSLGIYALAWRTIVKLSLPNLETTGGYFVRSCTRLTGIVNIPKATVGSNAFYDGLHRTTVLYVNKLSLNAFAGGTINTTTVRHLWVPCDFSWHQPSGASPELFRRNAVLTVQFDKAPSISGTVNFGGDKITALILRNPNGTTLLSTLPYISTRMVYVPKSLLSSFYAVETNWVTLYNSDGITAIDEDTTATVGTAFTPTTSATVDHWDQVDLQSYSVGTIDTTNGSITPTHDGRLLIRGFDTNDEIVHVTYLQIGTGFDEEQNLLENI